MNNRYHVRISHKRTTVSLDNILSALMSLYLGVEPGSPEAHKSVRIWMQERLDRANDPCRIHVSQWIKLEIVGELISKDLAEKYGDWLLRSG